MNWEEDGLDHLPEAADEVADYWRVERRNAELVAHTRLQRFANRLAMQAHDDWVNQKWCESLVDEWNDREEAVEAGHPLRHDRPTDEEWLIGDIDNYEDLRDVQRRG